MKLEIYTAVATKNYLGIVESKWNDKIGKKFLFFKADNYRNTLAAIAMAGELPVYWVDANEENKTLQIIAEIDGTNSKDGYGIYTLKTIFGACPSTFAVQID